MAEALPPCFRGACTTYPLATQRAEFNQESCKGVQTAISNAGGSEFLQANVCPTAALMEIRGSDQEISAAIRSKLGIIGVSAGGPDAA